MKMFKTKEKIRSLDTRVNIHVFKGPGGEICVILPEAKNRVFRFVFRGKGLCCVYGCPRPTVENNLLCFSCLGEAKDKRNEKELIKAARIASLARKIKKKI